MFIENYELSPLISESISCLPLQTHVRTCARAIQTETTSKHYLLSLVRRNTSDLLLFSVSTGGALRGWLLKSSIIWHTAAPSLVSESSDRVSRQCSCLDYRQNLLKLYNINSIFCLLNLSDMEPSAPKRCVLSGFKRERKLLKKANVGASGSASGG